MKGKVAAQNGDENDKKFEKKDGTEMGEEPKNVEKDQEETMGVQTADSVKPGKKKIIRRIVKQKVADKTASAENAASKQNTNEEGKSEVSPEQSKSLADPSGVRTFVRKKVVKKVPVGKTTQNEDKSLQPEVKAEKDMDCAEDKPNMDCAEDKPKDTLDTSSAAVLQGTSVKTTIKKKIIKRVLKRKLTGMGASDGIGEIKKDDSKDDKKVAQAGNKTENMGKQTPDTENQVSDAKKSEKKIIHNMKSKSPIVEQATVLDSNRTEIKASKEDKMHEKDSEGKSGSGTKVEDKSDKLKVAQKDDHNGKRGKSKDDLKDEKKDKDGRDESRGKSNKEVKEKRKPEEPPRHPGLILQTKGNKETKVG